MQNWVRRLLTIGVLIALGLPLLTGQDGLPLSTYPMYASTRTTETSIVTAVGVAADDSTVTLSMPVIAGTRDPLIAESYMRDAVRRGDTDAVCGLVARRSEGVVSIQVVTQRHDAVRRARGEPSLLGQKVHSTCEVSR